MKSLFVTLVLASFIGVQCADLLSYHNALEKQIGAISSYKNSKIASRATTTCTTQTADQLMSYGNRCNSTTYCEYGLDCLHVSGVIDADFCLPITTIASCTEDINCGYDNTTAICLNGKCAFIGVAGDSCSDNRQCQSFQCVSGKCAAKTAGQSCTGGDCALGLYCGGATASTRTCRAQVSRGSNCLAAFDDSATITDAFRVCDESVCLVQCAGPINSCLFGTGIITGATCTKPFDVDAGGVVSDYLPYLQCDTDTFAVPSTTNAAQYVCSKSSQCNDQNGCNTVAAAQCSCSNNSTGTCQLLGCEDDTEDYYECLIDNNLFGTTSIQSALYDKESTAYKLCYDDVIENFCCESEFIPSYFVPLITCPSSSAFASNPVVILISAMIAIALMF